MKNIHQLAFVFLLCACTSRVITPDGGTAPPDGDTLSDVRAEVVKVDATTEPVKVDATTVTPDATHDLSDVVTDQVVWEVPSTCPAEYLYIEIRLPNGTVLAECMPTPRLDISSSDCAYLGEEIASRGTDLVALVGRLARGEVTFLDRAGPVMLSTAVSTSDFFCGFPTAYCLYSPRRGECCSFDTRGQRTCRWNVVHPASVGGVVEMELSAPCMLRSYLPADAGSEDYPRGPDAVVLRGRIRGRVTRREYSTQPSHSDVIEMDCNR
jgi:hypothetical protein